MAGKLVRKLIFSFLTQTPWGQERRQTLELDPIGSSHIPNSQLLWASYVSKLCELPRVDKVGMRERHQMPCVIQTALGCGPEIQVLIAYSRRSEIPCT